MANDLVMIKNNQVVVSSRQIAESFQNGIVMCCGL